MIRELSMFSATEDLAEALSLVCATAMGLDRRAGGRMSFADCAARLTSEAGYAAFADLGRRLGVPAAEIPDHAPLKRAFDDELLSMKALRLHHGRNVYSAGKLVLWNLVWKPLRPFLLPDPETLRLARDLVAFDSRPGSTSVGACVEWLAGALHRAGFRVERIDPEDGNPILVARRDARGQAGRLVLYGHYDAAPTDFAEWASPPLELAERAGRLHGLAAGDNKVALAVRLRVLGQLERSPEIVWLLQGDEETGSRAAHRHFPALMRDLSATLHLEENGYQDDDGTTRLLARTIAPDGGEDLPPDAALFRLIDRLGATGSDFGVRHRIECRSLNKDFFATGCPFNRNLPPDARYLAIGVNDPTSGIHRPDESVPTWTPPLHARQLAVVMDWVDETARAAV